MKVNIEILQYGWILCLDKECPYKRECANHSSAGDFRSEGGFTPQLTIDGECKTKEMHASDCDYQVLPCNYDELTHGGLMIKNGSYEVYIN